jgi:hypothetical protein
MITALGAGAGVGAGGAWGVRVVRILGSGGARVGWVVRVLGSGGGRRLGRAGGAAWVCAASALVVAVSACVPTPAGSPPTGSPSSGPGGSGLRMSAEREVLGQWAGQVGDVAWAGSGGVAVVTRSGDVLLVSLTGDSAPRRLDRPPDGASTVAADPTTGVVVAWDRLSGRGAAWSAAGTRLADYQFGFAGVGGLAIRAGGDRLAIVGSGVSVVDVATGDALSRGERAEWMVEYNAVAYVGDRVVAWPGVEFTLDVWDVSGSSAEMVAHNCGCDYHRHALDPTAERAAFATRTGSLILWDVAGGRAVGQRAVVAAPDEDVGPLAVVGGRYVLYVIDRPGADGQPRTGPLMVWDSGADTVAELWNCPDCAVRAVLTRPGSDQILLAVAKGTDHIYWTATLTH